MSKNHCGEEQARVLEQMKKLSWQALLSLQEKTAMGEEGRTLQEWHFWSSCSVVIERPWRTRARVQEERGINSEAQNIGQEGVNPQEAALSGEESLDGLYWARRLWLGRCHWEKWHKQWESPTWDRHAVGEAAATNRFQLKLGFFPFIEHQLGLLELSVGPRGEGARMPATPPRTVKGAGLLKATDCGWSSAVGGMTCQGRYRSRVWERGNKSPE